MESAATPEQTKKLPGAFDLFNPSIAALKLNFWTFFWGTFIPFAILVIPAVLLISARGIQERTHTVGTTSPAITAGNIAAIIIGVVGVVLAMVIFLPFLYLLKLESAKGKKMGFKQTLRQSLGLFWRVLGLYIIRGLIIFVGFVLLIVPGFFMWRRYMLAPYYLIDQKFGIMDALNKSAEDSKPFSGAIWGMIGVYIAISLIGYVPLIGWLIGLILSVLYCCAESVRYLQIKAAR